MCNKQLIVRPYRPDRTAFKPHDPITIRQDRRLVGGQKAALALYHAYDCLMENLLTRPYVKCAKRVHVSHHLHQLCKLPKNASSGCIDSSLALVFSPSPDSDPQPMAKSSTHALNPRPSCAACAHSVPTCQCRVPASSPRHRTSPPNTAAIDSGYVELAGFWICVRRQWHSLWLLLFSY